MATTAKQPQDLIPLTPAEFHILLALTDEARHGYGIMQEVKKRTEGRVKMGPGTLYGAVKRMINTGVIEEADPPKDIPDDDERRKYYRLTSFGHRVAQAEANRLAKLVETARSKRLLPNIGGNTITR